VDAIDLALCNNPQTRQSWANAKAQAAQVGVARSAFLPTLSATASLQRDEIRNVPAAGGTTLGNANLSLNYLLFDFGGRDASLEQAQQSLQASDWTHNATLQSVLLTAVQSYYQLYATQEAVQSTLAAEKSSLTSLEAARARQRVGSATRADTLQTQTAYSQAQLNRTQAEGLKRIESSLGRRPSGRWGPRPIDIDILFFDELRFESDTLTIPHPRISERPFVLAPLSEVMSGPLPVLGQPAAELLAAMTVFGLLERTGQRLA
jgi:2-amino-4-hydroxy-6-hydroxymethyldihydropteridine diphosphokinase